MSRIDSLLSRMTLEEKVGQLNLVSAGQTVTGPSGAEDVAAGVRAGDIGGVFNVWGADAVAALQKIAVEETRLGIPLVFGLDVLHGHATTFPIPLAEAGSFDPGLWERTARAAAREAARDGIDLTFAPMLDVARDPRWGRIAEGPGEDPLVGERFARAKVRGFQGGDPSSTDAMGATAKHFCAGGAAQAGRDYAAVDLSERILREIYLPPFRAAVEEGCVAVMAAFNSVAGVPMAANVRLLRDCLRREFGFDGVIMSDYAAVAELVAHGVAADLCDAAALALKAGVDMDMAGGAYLQGLPAALAAGRIGEADIDVAVRRVLALKEKLGIFDDPYRRVGRRERNAGDQRDLALEAARRCIVLLENRGALPLSRNLRRIAVVGPLADAQDEMPGPWSGAARVGRCATVLDGLRAATDAEIVHHAGCAIEGGERGGIAEAVEMCRSVDAVILCLGESAGMSGEAASRASPGLPGLQGELAEAVLAAGVATITILFSGRPLVVPRLAERSSALIAAWFLGDEAGTALADVLAGRFNPVARLAATWPRDIGQAPVYYGALACGRPPSADDPFTSRYLDAPTDPLFAFGHGLSFARTRLSNLRASAGTFHIGAPVALDLLVDIMNEGNVATQETTFLFMRDLVASVVRPVLELKDWAKTDLEPMETKTVRFALAPDTFALPGAGFVPTIEPGEFELFVGPNAERTRLLSIRVRALPAPPLS